MGDTQTTSRGCRWHRTVAVQLRTSCRWLPPYALLLNGLKSPSDYTGHDIYLMFHSNYEEFLEDLSRFSVEEQDGTWNKLTDYIHNYASEEEASLFNQDISNLNGNLALGNLSDTA